ncbi:MAG: hypothetical protein A2206_01365 [Candidatus Magasanikbacteria bacterium RIFOXYA1_FULL_40_8]|uniref:Uncharacterized protein n=1 Tax=Candidatus Magasanikbacteria bacterium RIFOXYA1_FULL_40_8 TaxID=1798694 RepID=A0A1F6NTE5_9BACT|nr:MAG: hypothetical protein A2206_01365 [Candidatus Magasanikbacteria bacterium RIFOXYA1_FULL_40_8]
MKYTCRYISGGGTEYDGGIWEMKETPSKFIFTILKKSFYETNWDKLIIHKDEMKNKRHCLHDWEDGTFTIYPDQSGIPHIFSPEEKGK